ncbi:MAG: Holliday junction resolvase RuvX [Muribaculaceae bacterium]
MGRVIAIDYGRKRCGVAVTDPLRISANGLPTQRTCDLMDFLKSYCAREGVDLIVMGLPRTLTGEDSESARYIEPFLARLRREMPDMPVERMDERFTSAIAMQSMIAAGVKKSDRRCKELHDKTAAVIILTDWLNSRAGGFDFSRL